jgi:nucleoid-associated protein
MNLTRAIIHEIIKQPQVNGANSFLSQILLPVNPNTIRLAQSLNNAFSKDDISYGNFEINNNLFYSDFMLHQGALTDASIVTFTQEVTTRLSATLSVTFFAKGGFFVFCEYDLNGIRFIGVYLVRDVEGVLFNKDNVNHTFQINQVRYLDTNKLAMGARINLEKLTNADHNHIALTKSNQADISEYFIDWIGITRPESNADFTNKLFQIISSINRPVNPETGNQYDLNEFREVAFNLIKASPNRVVNLRDLSVSIFGDDNTLIAFAEESGHELDHEFRYDGRALNRFKRITANRDGIRLSFAIGDLDRKVTLSNTDNDLVTIRSRSLAESIRQQINLQ